VTSKVDAPFALSRIDAPQRATPPRPRTVMLVQTQAEGAGAQEITRILGHGLTARGYEVHHVFFFRRTAAFDQQPNTYFCATERPGRPLTNAGWLTDPAALSSAAPESGAAERPCTAHPTERRCERASIATDGHRGLTDPVLADTHTACLGS